MSYITTLFNDIVNVWKTKTKVKISNNGWYSGNAVCCVHNHETQDKRGRGGLALSDDCISWHCFNCGFKTSYKHGFVVGFKFKNLLKWFGFSRTEISRILLETMRERERAIQSGLLEEDKTTHPEIPNINKITFKHADLPDSLTFTETLDYIEKNNEVPDGFVPILDYVLDRKIDIDKYEFRWTPVSGIYKNRVIIPYRWKGDTVGHSARLVSKTANFTNAKKYITYDAQGYVFNIENQKSDWEYVIVCEGQFDAMSIDGVSVFNADITQKQIDIINSLNRQVIVLPDWDKSGIKLIKKALELNWAVSFPCWRTVCKDANDAVIKYGKLFTLHSVIKDADYNPLSIKIKIKLMSTKNRT